VAARSDAVVGRSFLKLGAGEVLARLIAFAATVYLARLLGAEVYGMIVLATAILLYVGCVTDCGIDQLGVRDIAHDRSSLAVLLPEYLGARLVVAAILIVLLVGLGLLVLPQPDGAVVAMYAFLLLPIALGARWAHLGLEQSGRAALARVLAEGVAALLIVVLVRGPEDVTHAPLAQLLGDSAGALLLLRLLPLGSGRFRPVVRLDVLRALFRRSWPVVGHTLLGLLIFNSDFFFLRIYRDSATVGYYAGAYTLVSFFLNLGASYEMSLLPAITRLGRQPDAQRLLYGSATAQVFAGAFPVAVGACLLAGPVVTLIFGAGYSTSALPLRILIWCVPIAVFRNVAQTGLIAHGRQDQMLRTAAWAAGINVLLNAVLIPFWGTAGAAFITVLTEALRTGLALRFARLAGLQLPGPRRFWRPLLAGGVMAAVVGLSGGGPLWRSVVAGAAVYLLTLLLVGGMRLRGWALPELTV
jgi:O-antigen/teichoic acid export membrane protein